MADGDANDQDLAGLIDTSVAHQSRIYDYWLGGKDNFAVDREAAEQALAAYPGLRRGVRAQRPFLAHAVRYLAGPAGIRQFLDIEPVSRPRATPTKSLRRSHLTPGSSTWTTIPWSWRTPARC